MTMQELAIKKTRGEKISMLTAYDFPTAYFLDQSGIDIILVGDSLANVVLGLKSTTQVGMSEMLHHCKAVSRAVNNALVVGDMPFESYQVDIGKASANARLFIEEGGCRAVKLEWFAQCIEVAAAIVKEGIPVMGHVGLTPQTAPDGMMKVQGKDAGSAQKIIDQARRLEQAGCFAVVLECIPAEVAQIITASLKIPTIGIGAGRYCDGQVLVTHDILGLSVRGSPKFAKKMTDLGPMMLAAFIEYKKDVTSGRFPQEQHSFHLPADELSKLR